MGKGDPLMNMALRRLWFSISWNSTIYCQRSKLTLKLKVVLNLWCRIRTVGWTSHITSVVCWVCTSVKTSQMSSIVNFKLHNLENMCEFGKYLIKIYYEYLFSFVCVVKHHSVFCVLPFNPVHILLLSICVPHALPTHFYSQTCLIHLFCSHSTCVREVHNIILFNIQHFKTSHYMIIPQRIE